MLNFYKQLISCRNSELALQLGNIKFAQQAKSILAYKRTYETQVIRVYLNFGYEVDIPLQGKVILQSGASQHDKMMRVSQYGLFVTKQE